MTLRQSKRPYQGKTYYTSSKEKVPFTIHFTLHFALEEGWGKMKLNEPERQELDRQNCWQ